MAISQLIASPPPESNFLSIPAPLLAGNGDLATIVPYVLILTSTATIKLSNQAGAAVRVALLKGGVTVFTDIVLAGRSIVYQPPPGTVDSISMYFDTPAALLHSVPVANDDTATGVGVTGNILLSTSSVAIPSTLLEDKGFGGALFPVALALAFNTLYFASNNPSGLPAISGMPVPIYGPWQNGKLVVLSGTGAFTVAISAGIGNYTLTSTFAVPASYPGMVLELSVPELECMPIVSIVMSTGTTNTLLFSAVQRVTFNA